MYSKLYDPEPMRKEMPVLINVFLWREGGERLSLTNVCKWKLRAADSKRQLWIRMEMKPSKWIGGGRG